VQQQPQQEGSGCDTTLGPHDERIYIHRADNSIAEIDFEQMDSRDVKSLFAPLGIPHPSLGNRQTAEYSRILRQWIGEEQQARTTTVSALIETQRSNPWGPPSAQDRSKKRAARAAAAGAGKNFVWCAWQHPENGMLVNENDANSKRMMHSGQEHSRMPDFSQKTRAEIILVNDDSEHSYQHMVVPRSQADPNGYSRNLQIRESQPNTYAHSTNQSISLSMSLSCANQSISQRPYHMRTQMEHSAAALSGHNNSGHNKRFRESRSSNSENTSCKRRRCAPLQMAQPQPDASTQYAHHAEFTAQYPSSHEPMWRFKPTPHEFRTYETEHPQDFCHIVNSQESYSVSHPSSAYPTSWCEERGYYAQGELRSVVSECDMDTHGYREPPRRGYAEPPRSCRGYVEPSWRSVNY